MRIAVEGCMHGDLDNVYSVLQHIEKKENVKIDLLICCGDFQAARNEQDLQSMNVKLRYRSMKDFWKYYAGKEMAPIPTIFIGGNHEASNYLWELYYGGWAAPNIYFLGFAGVVKFGNIRIAGLSGIYKEADYKLGHYERAPYDSSELRSIYHVREYDVHKLLQIEEPIDIFISHDWPRDITEYGNWRELVRKKPFFEKEIQEKSLGSKAAAELLEKLKPAYWFSGHLHCKFSAIIQHGNGGPITKFLALDKCVPGHSFLQVMEIEAGPGPCEILYDEEWLAITRQYDAAFPLTRHPALLGSTKGHIEDHRRWVRENISAEGLKPFGFKITAPPHEPSSKRVSDASSGKYCNPQTESFLRQLGLPYRLDNMESLTKVASGSASSSFRDGVDDLVDDEETDELDD